METKQGRLEELLRNYSENTRASNLVHATISPVRRKSFGGRVTRTIADGVANHDLHASGFVVIDHGKIYFYNVNGLGRNRTVTSHKEIAFSQIEKAYGNKGRITDLSIIWNTSDNRRLSLQIGGMSTRHFPDDTKNVNEMKQQLLENGIEIGTDKSTKMSLFIIFGILGICLILIIGLLLFYPGDLF